MKTTAGTAASTVSAGSRLPLTKIQVMAIKATRVARIAPTSNQPRTWLRQGSGKQSVDQNHFQAPPQKESYAAQGVPIMGTCAKPWSKRVKNPGGFPQCPNGFQSRR